MGAFKDKKSGSWYVQFRYTDWQGKRQQKLKRGFATKHEALEWEREFLLQKQTDVTMSFGSFYDLYKNDINTRLKEKTFNKKINQFLFTTPADVQDFALEELHGIPSIKGDSIYSPVEHKYVLNKNKKIFNIKGRNTIYIPINENQRNFLKQYVKSIKE